MATQTEYQVETTAAVYPVTISVGSATRQWMTPQGLYINEVVSGGGGGGAAARPMVQSFG